MIDAIEGIPGSGKSYEACVYHILAAVKAGRLVITNLPVDVEAFERVVPGASEFIEKRTTPQPIRGRWNYKAAGTEAPVYELFEDGHVEDPPETAMPFGGVWDFYSPWRREDGRGPLYVIDECHVGMPTLGTDKAVIQWFKIHRHFNADVLLMTQSFRDFCQEIARLIRTLVKVRKADILGKKDQYIRKVHSGYRGGLVSEERRPYKPQYFGLYKSHTQGQALEEEGPQDVTSLYVKVQRAKWIVFGLAVVATVWAWWPSSKPAKPVAAHASWVKSAQARAGKPMTAEEVAAQEAALRARAPAPAVVQASYTPSVAERMQLGGSAQPTSADGVLPEPFGPKGLHLLGRLTLKGRSLYMLSISQNGQVVSSTTSAELEQVGYTFRPLSDCVAAVGWGRTQRVVTCDSPSIQLATQPRVATQKTTTGEAGADVAQVAGNRAQP